MTSATGGCSLASCSLCVSIKWVIPALTQSCAASNKKKKKRRSRTLSCGPFMSFSVDARLSVCVHCSSGPSGFFTAVGASHTNQQRTSHLSLSPLHLWKRNHPLKKEREREIPLQLQKAFWLEVCRLQSSSVCVIGKSRAFCQSAWKMKLAVIHDVCDGGFDISNPAGGDEFGWWRWDASLDDSELRRTSSNILIFPSNPEAWTSSWWFRQHYHSFSFFDFV